MVIDETELENITRVCTNCNEEKKGTEFYRCRRSKHGIIGMCIPCRREKNKADRPKYSRAKKEGHELTGDSVKEFWNINEDAIYA